jgi:hypothetical protein
MSTFSVHYFTIESALKKPCARFVSVPENPDLDISVCKDHVTAAARDKIYTTKYTATFPKVSTASATGDDPLQIRQQNCYTRRRLSSQETYHSDPHSSILNPTLYLPSLILLSTYFITLYRVLILKTSRRSK